MGVRLHRGGRLRGRIGAALGGDTATGDRALRRLLHLAGLAVLLYYVLPTGLFGPVPKAWVLVAALAAVLLIEAGRLVAGVELPTIRPYEARRLASYAWYAVALVAAVLLLPVAVAVVVVVGTAIVDPVIGELRRRPAAARADPWAPVALYGVLAVGLLVGVGGWAPWRAAAGAVAAAVTAVAAERPKLPYVDDDLAMTLVPAAALLAVGAVGPGAPIAAG